MNLMMNSDQPVDVEVFVTFIDQNSFKFVMRLEGHGPVTFCVVGRRPRDILSLEIEYNGHRFAHPVVSSDGEHLDMINIYGGRDHWSQVLREKALAAA